MGFSELKGCCWVGFMKIMQYSGFSKRSVLECSGCGDQTGFLSLWQAGSISLAYICLDGQAGIIRGPRCHLAWLDRLGHSKAWGNMYGCVWLRPHALPSKTNCHTRKRDKGCVCLGVVTLMSLHCPLVLLR